MKRNKWIVIGIVLLTILTPRVALAKGFHDDGGGGHIEFHDDDGGAGHEDFDDGDDSVTSDGGETQSFGLRVKDTFNYLIPQDWHGSHSSYSHISSGMYEWGFELIELVLDLWMSYIVLVDFIWEDLPDIKIGLAAF